MRTSNGGEDDETRVTREGGGNHEFYNNNNHHHNQFQEDHHQDYIVEEENNNNLEIEENNNYQISVNLVGASPCRSGDCTCLATNQFRQTLGDPFRCTCPKEDQFAWSVETQCCAHRPPTAVQQPVRTYVDLPDLRSPSPIIVVPTTPESISPPPLKKFKKFESPSKKLRNSLRRKPLSLSRVPKRKNVEESPPAKKAKVAEICFVSCESDSTEPSAAKSADPLAKLSVTNREKRQKVDSLADMYDHRQFAESAGVVAPTGFYNPNKLPSTTAIEDIVSTTVAPSAANQLDSNKTIATLCNIGNSCYLNSVAYTLRFAPLFLHKLHHLIEDMATIYIKLNPTKQKSSSLGRNVSLWSGHSGRSWSSKDLASLGSISSNDMLPKNNRLIVTEKLHELYQNLHKNEATLNGEPLHAGAFLQAIQEVCSIFEGNQQQDAHECLMCILDSIRETCDTLASAIIDNPEQLLQEYGVVASGSAALLEEARDELAPMPPTTAPSTIIASYSKLFSRKSKRKKSDDEKAPDSPSKSAADPTSESAATAAPPPDQQTVSPTTDQKPEDLAKNLLLKLLSGSGEDFSDREKLKKAVCKQLGLNFFCEDFEGVSVSSIKCLTCETVRNCEETMIDISVPITGHENPDSMSNPQMFFQVS